MSEQISSKIEEIQRELIVLKEKKDFFQAQKAILSIIRLLDDSISIDDKDIFQLFTDSDGKIRANGSWFYEDPIITDRKATYKVCSNNNLNIDFKLYGVKKPIKRIISWVQALTPNFEDEPFNKNFNVGIDFVVPESFDKVIIILSNNWIIRTLELKGELTATYQEIFAKWAEIKHFDNKQELHKILWDSFDIHPLNKKFYAGISERFNILRQYLVKNKVFDEKHASFFTNRLLGRIIFCWFLSKKGIINPDFKYFDSESLANDNEYYREKLEKLFFGVLNIPIEDRKVEDNVTPFLNGGLFEARENDLYKDLKLIFPKNYFDDLYKFLMSYNFTTDESTSQFQQVAIDPEMLGRIFENLLAEITEETGDQARKAKGAFYTPREIVDYMCKESLREYLKTKIKEDEFRDQRLYQLIDAPDKDFQDQDHNWRRDWKPYKEDIIKALDELKVLDPACGSGAFPIGMLQLLVRVYERLESRFDSYKTKLRIIEKNIYGVDIEPMAVEISRLRTWLSIIVDEESDSRKIKPLPNLEFKFVCANSLIDLDNGTSVLGEDQDLDIKLQNIRDAYFNTENLNRKKKLRLEYEKLVNKQESLFGESLRSKQLKTYKPFDNENSAAFFKPEFMFGVKNFDMVIGNPPYVNVEKINKNIKDNIKDFKTAFQKYDLYVLFYEKGINFLKEAGILCFITSNKFLSQGYGKKLRYELLKHRIINIINFNFDIFENATVRTCVLIFSKQQQVLDNKIKIINISSKKDEEKFKKLQYSFLNQNIFKETEENNFRLNLNVEKINLLDKIKKNTLRLEDICSLNYGLRACGKKGEFVKKDIVFNQPNKNTKPYFEGKNTGFWTINENSFLEYNSSKLYNAMFPELFEKPKLVGLVTLSDISKLRFVFDKDGFYCNHSVVIITLWYLFKDLKNLSINKFKSIERIKNSEKYNYYFLQGILNSKLIKFYFNELMYDGTHFYPNQMKSLPIKKTEEGKQTNISDLVKQIIIEKTKNKNADIKYVEGKIDELVMDLYELTKSEKEIIRNSIN